MNKKRCAKEVYRALADIDPELLYDARAYRAPKIRPYLRYAVAAAIILVAISAALILSAASTVKSYLTVDTNYGVMLELNADNRIVKATSTAAMYMKTAEKCRGTDADSAVGLLLDSMSKHGGLTENANTVLFGATDHSADLADRLVEALDTEGYCVMQVAVSDDDALQKLMKKRRITAGKAALLSKVSKAEGGLSESLLFRLSANDIALLMTKRGLQPEGVAVRGKPCDKILLPVETIKRIALTASESTPKKIVCELDSDGFRLIYTVLLYEGDQGVAYFIDAVTGEIQKEIRGKATTLQQQVERAREEYGAISENTPPEQNTPVEDVSPTQIPSTVLPASETAATQLNTTPATASTDKPSVTEQPTEGATEAPSASVPEETASDPPAPENDNFLTARSFHDTDLEDMETVLDGDCVHESYREDPDYADHNPRVVLIANRAQLMKYYEVYPDQVPDEYYLNRYMSDGWFDDHALIFATNTEFYVNTPQNHWYAFIKRGGILCVGCYNTKEDFERSVDSKYAAKYEIPNSVTYGIEISKNLSEIKTIWIMELEWADTKNLIWLW